MLWETVQDFRANPPSRVNHLSSIRLRRLKHIARVAGGYGVLDFAALIERLSFGFDKREQCTIDAPQALDLGGSVNDQIH